MLLGLPHLEMVGWGGIYRPQHNSSHWGKAAALYDTPDSSVPPSGALSRWTDTADDRWRACFLHQTL
jgi:hypothetical protein